MLVRALVIYRRGLSCGGCRLLLCRISCCSCGAVCLERPIRCWLWRRTIQIAGQLHAHTRTHRVELASAFVANSYTALAMRLPPCTVQTCCLLPTNIPQEHYSRGQGCRHRLHTCSVPSLNALLASIVTSSSFWTALVPFTPLPLPFRDGPAPFVFESNTELRELPPGRTGYVTPRPLEDWTCKRFIR